jgi:23S rRNA pseudouridine1911/1915/1917 synthase
MAVMTNDQATATRSWSVGAENSQMRLDAFARTCLPHLSRRAIAEAMQHNFFRVNGHRAEKGAKVARGDVITFEGPASLLSEGPPPSQRLTLPIVYEDDALLVVDKPAGIATHGFSGADLDTVANFIAAVRPEILPIGRSPWEPGLVHRLDRDTSGLLIVAKTDLAFDHLRGQFRARQVQKKYLALVSGVAPAKGIIRFPLAHDPQDGRRMIVLRNPLDRREGQKVWPAVTRFRRRSGSNEVSFLEVEMESGVTHQIRAHLAAIGNSIVGDTLYGGDEPGAFGLKRHFLHASRLEFTHPVQLRRLKIESELPAELETLLRRFGVDPDFDEAGVS